jgi:hypothetical protein
MKPDEIDDMILVQQLIGVMASILARDDSMSGVDAAVNGFTYNFLGHKERDLHEELQRRLLKCAIPGELSTCSESDREWILRTAAQLKQASSDNVAALNEACAKDLKSEACRSLYQELVDFDAALKVEEKGYSGIQSPEYQLRTYQASLDKYGRTIWIDRLLLEEYRKLFDDKDTSVQSVADVQTAVVNKVVDAAKRTNRVVAAAELAADIAGVLGGGAAIVVSGGAAIPLIGGGLAVLSGFSHGVGSAQQLVTGVITEPGLVSALKAGGMDAETAMMFQVAVDAGAIVFGGLQAGMAVFSVTEKSSPALKAFISEYKASRSLTSADDVLEARCVGTLCTLCSFDGDTLVKADRGFVAIKDIRAGEDSVWSRDERTGAMTWKPVLNQYSNPYDETVSVTIRDAETNVRQTIVSNRIHPYFVQIPGAAEKKIAVNSSEGHVYNGEIPDGYWVDAADLKPGYLLLNDDNSWAEVETVEVEAKPLQAYNLTVADYHTYFVAANDNAAPVWVHNDCNTVSARRTYMGNTPGKNSSTGKDVIKRMLREGKISGEGDDLRVYVQLNEAGEYGWVKIAFTDMGHVVPAVVAWNKWLFRTGARSRDVWEFMHNADNYQLQYFRLNRSRGALLRVTYRPPLSGAD